MKKLKYKNILTKRFLIEHYITQIQSLLEISRVVGSNPVTIMNYLKKFDIERREAKIRNPENNPNYKDGRTKANHYCIEINCNHEISYNNWLYGTKKCRSCASKGINNGRYIDGRKSKPYYCERCGNVISYKCVFYGHSLCIKCVNIGRFKGSKHWNWKGGKLELYPLGWTNTFREQIRFRDGYKCQICGCPEVECNRKLSVHHIDYNKENIEPDNLTSLCVSCHGKTTFNRKSWKQYFQSKIGEYGNEEKTRTKRSKR